MNPDHHKKAIEFMNRFEKTCSKIDWAIIDRLYGRPTGKLFSQYKDKFKEMI